MKNSDLANITSQQVRAGLKWTAFIRLLAQLINWGMSIVVIRYIRPDDFGMKSMAELTLALLVMLTSGGLQTAIIYSKELNKNAIRKIFGLLIIINLSLFIIQILSAYPLAAFYNEPRVQLIAQVMALGFLVSPFISLPSALLSRDMEFKLQSTISLLSNTIGGVVTLALAIKGYGVWSLVIGPQVASILSAILLNIYKPCLCVPNFSLHGVKDMAGYGGVIALASVLWMVYSKVDVFIAGRFLTAHEVGLYALALHLASMPVDKLMPILNQVAFPAFSKLRDDKELIAKYYLKAVRLTSFVLLPLSFGLAGIADYFVPVVLGDEWNGSRDLLKILCMVFPIRAIVSLCSSMANAMGRPRIGLQYSVLATILMVPAFLIGVQYGSLGLSMAWLFVFPWVMLVNVIASLRVINVTFLLYVKSMLPSFLMSGIMLAVLLCFASTEAVIQNIWVTIGVMVFTGCGIYVAGMFVFSKGQLIELYNMIK